MTTTPAVSTASPTADFPEFAITVRGYDRGQVEDYVTSLREVLAAAEDRADQAEEGWRQAAQAAQAATAEVTRLEAELRARPDDQNAGASVGERVGRILSLADEEAAERRAEAARVAADIRAEAERAAAARAAEAEQAQRSAEAELAEIVARRTQVLADLRTLTDKITALVPAEHLPALASLGPEAADTTVMATVTE